MNNREKMWTAAHDLIEGLRPKFVAPLIGNVADIALMVAYENITDSSKLSDAEVDFVISQLEKLFK